MANGYYPLGADYDTRAPWNQKDNDAVTKDVNYTCTLSRTAPVSTTDYMPGTEWIDEEGYYYREGDDFSRTDWVDEFTDTYRTPRQLISLLADIAESFIAGVKPQKSINAWQSIAADCRGWEVDDEDAEEE